MSEARFYGWLLGAWVVVALATVPYLLLRPAPYGRHGRPGWGKVVKARLAWVLMELPSPLLMTVMFCLGDRRARNGRERRAEKTVALATCLQRRREQARFCRCR